MSALMSLTILVVGLLSLASAIALWAACAGNSDYGQDEVEDA